MLNSTSAPSLSDIAAVTGNNDGFTGNSGWWILIILFAIFGGWGNGWGNNNSQTSGAYDNYVLASDFATLQRQIDSAASSLETKGDQINNGLCDGFYAMNTSLLNGFSGVNTAITTNGYDTRNAIQQAQISEMQNANALQSAINSGFCTTNYNSQSSTRDIIDAQNAGTQSILAAINQMNNDAKDSKIADLTAQVQALNLAASQQAQNNYLISQIRPAAIPAYTVANPYAGTGYCYGCNS